MSLTININLPDTEIADPNLLDRHMAHLGFNRVFATRLEGSDLHKVAADAIRKKLDQEPEGRTIGEAEALAKAVEPVAEDKPKRGRKPKEQPVQQAISTGEERVNPEDDAETEAQDRADEEAEEKGEDAPVDERPISELILAAKSALGDYVAKHGTDAALEDGAAIFKSVLGDPKEGVWKWAIVAEQPRESVLAVVEAWQNAAAASTRFVA